MVRRGDAVHADRVPKAVELRRAQNPHVELCLSRADGRASVLTKQQRRNQRRREWEPKGGGTVSRSALQDRQRQTERRTEMGSSSKGERQTHRSATRSTQYR